MPAYENSRYSPPAAIARVTLRDSRSVRDLPDVIMLIDSGSDITFIPKDAMASLGLAPIVGVEYQVEDFQSKRSQAEAIDLDLVFLGRVFRGRFLLTSDPDGILGRDALNHLKLILDGPAQEWSEHP